MKYKSCKYCGKIYCNPKGLMKCEEIHIKNQDFIYMDYMDSINIDKMIQVGSIKEQKKVSEWF